MKFLALADRIAVMYRGQIMDFVEAEDFRQGSAGLVDGGHQAGEPSGASRLDIVAEAIPYPGPTDSFRSPASGYSLQAYVQQTRRAAQPSECWWPGA